LALYGFFFLVLIIVFKTFKQERLFTVVGLKNLKYFYQFNLILYQISAIIWSWFSVEDFPFFAMIVSHADMDHSGGALSVLAAMPVKMLLSSLPNHHPISQAAMTKEQCRAGQSWQWDGVSFELLHPLANNYANSRRKVNANSCVLKITSSHGSVLLPADIEAKDEQALLSRTPDQLPTTVLIAPHHGSHTSSTVEFVQTVNPALTIFTVGYLNRYDHPREAVMARYDNLGSQLLRSDRDGAILLRFADNQWSADSWRELYRRYWHQPMAAVTAR